MEILKHNANAPHGEPDGGAVGVSGVVEKDINLAIVQKLQEVLESKGFEVILTRSGDSGLPGRKCRDYSQNESIGYEQTVRYYEKQSRRYFCEHTYEFVR